MEVTCFDFSDRLTFGEMDEFQPLLQGTVEKLKTNPFEYAHAGAIVLSSVLNFVMYSFLNRILILQKDNAHYLIPFVMNIFVENQFILFIMNPILSAYLMDQLLSYWKVEKIAMFAFAAGLASNTVTWFLLQIVSFMDKSFEFEVCGSLSTLIALAEAVAFVSISNDVPTFTKVKAEIFWVIVVLAIAAFSLASFSVFISAVLSYFMLKNYSTKFGIARNDSFDLKAFSFVRGKKKEDKNIDSIVDSLGLAEGPGLSELDKNRRMRALRAIEERLEAFESPK